MNKFLQTSLNVIILVAGLYLAATNVTKFEDAHDWLELFKAVFWMVVGSVCFWGGIDELKSANPKQNDV